MTHNPDNRVGALRALKFSKSESFRALNPYSQIWGFYAPKMIWIGEFYGPKILHIREF
jgi:hypothetical protein